MPPEGMSSRRSSNWGLMRIRKLALGLALATGMESASVWEKEQGWSQKTCREPKFAGLKELDRK